MNTKAYRSLAELATMWSREPLAPGDKEQIRRMLIAALCDGAFFEDGVFLRAHSLLLAIDPTGEAYAPYSMGAEILPDGSLKTVPADRAPDIVAIRGRWDLHSYLVTPDSVPEAAMLDPEAFFDWVKNTDPTAQGEAVNRLFAHVTINVRAFRNWHRRSRQALPALVAEWPESLPADPNHRGPQPLPREDFISLCEAVTWLTTGRARPAPVVLRLLDRHSGTRWPRGLWREMEEDADSLISALRRGELTAYGQLEGGPHALIPRTYFASDIFAEFAKDLIAPDPLAFSRGTYPEGLPTIRSVRFERDILWNAMRDLVRRPKNNSDARRRSTAAGGKRCLNWLIELMRVGPQVGPKDDYKKEALEKFDVSGRQFASAWAQAKNEVGNLDWGRAGRRNDR